MYVYIDRALSRELINVVCSVVNALEIVAKETNTKEQ